MCKSIFKINLTLFHRVMKVQLVSIVTRLSIIFFIQLSQVPLPFIASLIASQFITPQWHTLNSIHIGVCKLLLLDMHTHIHIHAHTHRVQTGWSTHCDHSFLMPRPTMHAQLINVPRTFINIPIKQL